MATKTELSVEEKLKKIYEVQIIDSEIDNFANLKGTLPMEVNDIEDNIEGLQKRVKKLDESIEDENKKIKTHKEKIITSESLIEKYKKQLDDVKNNREFEALTKEIEMQSLDIQLSNKRIKEFEEFMNVKQEKLENVNEKLSKLEKELKVKIVELKEIIEKTEKEEEKLLKKSDKLKKGINERLLRSYTRIRNRYNNRLAVVTIKRSSCGGCFNSIPPQVQIEISSRKNIIACEHCGRILVDNDLAAEFEK